ncbi:hypothetical protein AB0O65_12350 [Microbacterium sp. NPDC077391]|uniref:hypothetical protein n=1 Tax=unclassified Microbacterium TaxID=2609290 RepID=UPI001161239B|nr:hypothetical protein [Microbacterium sp. AR7-10]
MCSARGSGGQGRVHRDGATSSTGAVGPTVMLAVFGRQDGPFAEQTVRRICRGSDRYADRFDLAFVDGAAHFIVDDAPDAVADLCLDWFARNAGAAAQRG